MTEEPHEKHNRIAAEMAEMLVREFPEADARMVVLESIVTAILGTLRRDEHRYRLARVELRHMLEAVKKRLDKAAKEDKL